MGKGRLCFSSKVVEYSPYVCIIESYSDYLYTMKYGRILFRTHWVSAVVVVAVVVVEVFQVVEVVVEVLPPSGVGLQWPAMFPHKRQGRAWLI